MCNEEVGGRSTGGLGVENSSLMSIGVEGPARDPGMLLRATQEMLLLYISS